MSKGAPGSRSENAVRSGRDDEHGLFDLLIEQVVDYAIFVIDPAGRIASWNAGAQRIKGYTPQEIIGQPYAIFFGEDDRAAGKPQQILGRARAEGRVEDEGWRLRKDGSRFWASVVVTALRDPGGELRGFAKITRDLTERRRAEEEARRALEERAARRQAELDRRELRRSRDQLDLVLRSIAEGVTLQDAQGRLVFANDAAARLSGFDSSEEMLAAGMPAIVNAFEILREDGSPFPWEELPGRLALQGEASTAVVRFKIKRTGEERWSMVSGAPVKDAGGTVELAVNVFRDFTDLRRAEQAWKFLSEASAVLGSSLDYESTMKQVADLAVPRIADWCGVDILDRAGNLQQLAVAHVNPAKRELAREWRLRWPPRPDSPSYRVAKSGSPELLPAIPEAMLEALPDPEQRRVARELVLRSAIIVPLIVGQQPFGTVSFVSAESGRRYDEQDLIVATEIGRRASLAIENARAYTEARAAIETRDNFLAIASHELRTPLSGLTVLLSSLIRVADQGRLMQLGAEGLRERIVKAERQTRQLTRLVDRLLDVSRLATRDLWLERERIDLAEVVRDVVSRYEDAAAETGTRIDVAGAPGAAATVGWWDRSRLDQVVSNLLGNALKYAAGAPVRISVGASGAGHARLAVQDRGPGIPVEHQDRIFGQFQRAAPSDQVPGMGLGLWLVRRIVTAHGGSIALESSPGQGATFTIVLPKGKDAGGEGDLPIS